MTGAHRNRSLGFLINGWGNRGYCIDRDTLIVGGFLKPGDSTWLHEYFS
jgi:hypothetical protein